MPDDGMMVCHALHFEDANGGRTAATDACVPFSQGYGTAYLIQQLGVKKQEN